MSQLKAYTYKLPVRQDEALQKIWLELKTQHGVNSPDKSGMVQLAIDLFLHDWATLNQQDGLLQTLMDIRQDTRERQYRKQKQEVR